ncbi:hypothetical protein [Sulfitobacter sp. PM12]|uniref:hypothetical protein n=1 Tax=Sulfitobacter sp. PM12 TaxID=3138497 RepID=UPI00388E7A33
MSLVIDEIDVVHGALLHANYHGLSLRDVLSVFQEMPEITDADNFGAAVTALILLKGAVK